MKHLCVVAGAIFYITLCVGTARAGWGLLDFVHPEEHDCFTSPIPKTAVLACTAALRSGIQSEKRPHVLLQRAHAYEALGKFDLAMQDHDEVLASQPWNHDALNDGCWDRAVQNVQLDIALNECGAAVSSEPGNWAFLDSRCFVYFRMGNFAKAIADCDAATKANPSASSPLYLRGLAKLKTGDFEGGTADIGAAKAIEPRIVEAYAGFGVTP